MAKDVMIVGAGLAGSILAWKLLQAGKSIQILHNPEHISASRVAAGMINPVTGQRLVLQQHIEIFLPAAKAFYQSLTQVFHRDFYIAKPMLRIFKHQHEYIAWEKRKHDKQYQPYLSEIEGRDDAIMQKQTGYLDTQALLDALHGYFKDYGCLIEADSKTDNIDQYSAQTTILCQGWRGMRCPYFSYLPFQPAKGEILTLSTEQALPEYMINQGKWLLPTHRNTCKLGASYQTQPLDEVTSQEAKDDLLKALTNMPIEQEAQNVTVLQHQAGVRPNTLDKQPFLGFHPKHTHIGIFNGFGSKGSLLIPWHAEQMLQHILHKTPLPEHADIQRFACA